MSSFKCSKCGAEILDSPRGYTTSCKHYKADYDPVKEARKNIMKELEMIKQTNRNKKGRKTGWRKKLI